MAMLRFIKGLKFCQHAFFHAVSRGILNILNQSGIQGQLKAQSVQLKYEIRPQVCVIICCY